MFNVRIVHQGNSSSGYDIGWWNEEHFNASDADGNGALDMSEFNE